MCMAFRYALGIDLPDFVIEHPVIKALDQSTNDLVTWSNVSPLHYPLTLMRVDGWYRISFPITSNNHGGTRTI